MASKSQVKQVFMRERAGDTSPDDIETVIRLLDNLALRPVVDPAKRKILELAAYLVRGVR
jgi:hypothetical protein